MASFKDIAVEAIAEALFTDRKQHLLSLGLNVASLDAQTQTSILELVSQPSPWCLPKPNQEQLKLVSLKILQDLDAIGLLNDCAKE